VSAQYADLMELVPLTVVNNEMEAEVLCGELRAAGIECGHRPATSAGMGTAFLGPHEVLVDAEQVESAQDLLARDDSAAST
jgi:Putative prokaryotic signal transducing protein